MFQGGEDDRDSFAGLIVLGIIASLFAIMLGAAIGSGAI